MQLVARAFAKSLQEQLKNLIEINSKETPGLWDVRENLTNGTENRVLFSVLVDQPVYHTRRPPVAFLDRVEENSNQEGGQWKNSGL